ALPCPHRPRRRDRPRPDGGRCRLLGRTGRIAPVVGARARCGLGAPPRQARPRCIPARRRTACLRVVPDGPEARAQRGGGVIVAATITYFQAVVLGLLQGVTELFPISSLGHSVILPTLFGWDIHQDDSYFLSFL